MFNYSFYYDKEFINQSSFISFYDEIHFECKTHPVVERKR